jgi:transcriptional regulator with XRE-family HTH domain
MALPSSTAEKRGTKGSKPDGDGKPQSHFRTVRIQRGLSQADVARLAGLHRNSISKLENGTTKEVTAESADALARVLKTSIAKLGLRVRAATEPRSIRIRQLTAEQRELVDELLSLPPEDFTLIRDAIERLREKRPKRRG